MESPRLGISAHAAATPNKAALVSGDVTRTFAEFDVRSSRLAAALAERGVDAGDRVAVMLPNGIEFFETWAVATKLNAPVVLVNWHLKADELAYIVRDSKARALVAHHRLAAQYERALAGIDDCAVVVVPDQASGRHLRKIAKSCLK